MKINRKSTRPRRRLQRCYFYSQRSKKSLAFKNMQILNSPDLPKNRYGVHKITQRKTETFMLFPAHSGEQIQRELKAMSSPSEELILQLKAKYPHLSAQRSTFSKNTNDKISYGGHGLVQYRRSPYLWHIYKFTDNNYSKIEIGSFFDPKERSADQAIQESIRILEKVTFGVRHVDAHQHSLK